MPIQGFWSDASSAVQSFVSDLASLPARVKSRLRDVSPSGSLFDYMTSSRGLVDDIVKGTVPQARIVEFARSLRQSQDTLDLMYQRVQAYKANPLAAQAAGVNVAALERVQQELYGAYTYMDFWGQVIPSVRVELKKAGVRAADFQNAKANSSLIRAYAKVAGIDSDLARYKAEGALAGLGALPVAAILAIAAAAIAVSWAAYASIDALALTWRNSQDKEQQSKLVACVAAGGPAAAECGRVLDKALKASVDRERDRPSSGLGSLTGLIVAAGAVALGVIFLPTLLEASKTGAARLKSARGVNGLSRRRRSR